MEKRNIVQRYPVMAFYVLAFALSWLGWVPQALHARGLFPFDSPALSLLGGGGPTLAAVIVLAVLREREGLRRLFAALVRVRASAWWYAATLGYWPLATAVALGLGALGGWVAPALGRLPWGALLPIFVTMLVSNVWEEIGWRGFALPRLQARYGDLAASLLMGLLWSVWHLPLLANPASPMAGLPWYGELVFSLALTVIYTWLYRGTGGSLFFVSVFHALSNTVAFALLEAGVFVSSYPFVVGVTALVALGIVWASGPRRFG